MDDEDQRQQKEFLVDFDNERKDIFDIDAENENDNVCQAKTARPQVRESKLRQKSFEEQIDEKPIIVNHSQDFNQAQSSKRIKAELGLQ